MISYRVVPLADLIKILDERTLCAALSDFRCGLEKDLEYFLSNKAVDYENEGKGKSFLVIDDDLFQQEKEIRIIAYYTLALTAIDTSTYSDNKKKKIVGDYPNRTQRNSFPAFLIGQLGRDDRYSKEQLDGKTIMCEVYHTLKTANSIIGCKLVVLECREHMFEKVYSNLGYKKMVDELNDYGLYMLYNRVDFNSY